jgi:hypothetical protein
VCCEGAIGGGGAQASRGRGEHMRGRSGGEGGGGVPKDVPGKAGLRDGAHGM